MRRRHLLLAILALAAALPLAGVPTARAQDGASSSTGAARPIVPTPPPPTPPVSNAPDHRILVTFTVNERQWSKLSQPIVMRFDSARAHLFNQDVYLEGHAQQDATGHIWRSWLEPTPFGDPARSLRITWWHYRYADGTWWIAGAIMSDSIEAPLSRMKGTMEVALAEPDGTIREQYPSGIANVGIETGFSFSFGTPGRFLNLAAAKYFIDNFGKAAGQLPPERMWEPETRPDSIGATGDWLPKWTPRRIDVKNADGSWVYPGYWATSDPRNPPIGATIGEIEVPNLYEDQTHAHHRETYRSKYETGWQAHERAGDRKGVKTVLKHLAQWNARQVGTWSPKLGPPYWIDGRPIFLAGLDGWLPDAGVRYNLTATDQGALKSWIGHEGRVEITKGCDWQFPECFGQDACKPTSENSIDPLELAAGKFGGQYIGTQAWDLEHGGVENVAAGCYLLADPTAYMHLHHWAEEYLTNGLVKHSSRSTAGWMIETELHAFLVFSTKPTFRDDSRRYLDYARMLAQWVWQARLDETAYQGLIGRNYGDRDLSIPESQTGGFEGAFQAGIALNAFCMGWQVDPDPLWKGLWLELVAYTAKLFTQPGIVQRPTAASKGGILDSWNLLGPVPEAQMPGASIEDRLRANSGAYKGVDWLADQGWAGPALSKAARVLKAAGRPNWQAIDLLASEIRGYQAARVWNGVPFLSPRSPDAWGFYFEHAVTYGWPQ